MLIVLSALMKAIAPSEVSVLITMNKVSELIATSEVSVLITMNKVSVLIALSVAQIVVSVMMAARIVIVLMIVIKTRQSNSCLLYTSPSPRDGLLSRMPSSA